jgi:hypothetical protein
MLILYLYNTKKGERMKNILEIDINLGDRDLSFISEMVAGGVSDDGSPLIGDVSFNDVGDVQNQNDSDSYIPSESEVEEFMKSLGIE